jgi:apolipoprotein N-acyltransferase
VAKKNILPIVYFVLSAVLLTLCQPPYSIAFLAWVAFVPFVIASLVNEKNLPIILVSYIVGLLYWLGNLYWLIPITIPGWIVVCLYLAVYWPILAMSLRYCVRKGIPLWFSLPILVVGAEAAWGWLFSWRFLAHSQYRNIPLIQIADIFGTAGISFVIAMINGVACESILSFKNNSFRKSVITGSLITAVILAATLYYGRYKIDQTKRLIEAGPKIGVVQSNVPVKSGVECEPAEITFLNMLTDSRNCLLQAKPSLIIWPETMVEAILDESYLNLIGEDSTTKIFHNALIRHANEGVYLLVGAFAGDADVVDDKIELKTNYNSAFLYGPNDIGPRRHYDKIKIVPFGEYIPFKNSLPFMMKLLKMLTPYTNDYMLDAGGEYTIFKMPAQAQNKIYRFGVMICYEDSIPKIGRKLTLDNNGNKRADWLVNITNDGWFVRKSGEKIKASSELSQHMAVCVFRAVENRLSVIRCANTGISCLIDSLGNIKDDFSEGTLSKQTIQRTGQRGWFADTVTIDKRVTAFSKYGQLLDIGCAICFILTAVVSIYNLRTQKA